LTDTRDVIFQESIDRIPSLGIHAFEEDRGMTIGKCPYNSLWMQLGYGDAYLRQLDHFPILCVGSICGDFNSVLCYTEALAREIEAIQPKTPHPQDQAAHNYLVRCREYMVRVWKNEEGAIYTVGYIRPHNTVIVKEGKILNRSGDVPAVVHQWDRHDNLKGLVGGLYD
jgi:hypothetical protein